MKPEAFLGHTLHEKLEQLHNAYSSGSALEKIDHERRSFFAAVYNYIKDRLKSCIPELIKEGELNPIWAEVEAGTQQINEFLGDGNDGHLQNAINHLSVAVSKTKGLPHVAAPGGYDYAKTVAELEKALVQTYSTIEAERVQLNTKVTGLHVAVVNSQTKLEELGTRIAEKELEVQNIISKATTDFENFKNTSQANFDVERKKSLDLLEDDRKANKQLFEADKVQFTTEFISLKESFASDSKALQEKITLIHDNSLKALGEKLDEAKKIVNVIGNVGVTGNYQNIANEHKKNADTWRWIAIFFMGIMAVSLIWSIIDLSHGEFNLYRSIIRVVAAAILTYPAVYAAKESTRHRNLETHNRNLELELASIGPFIEMLPDIKKELIKEELVKRYFGNSQIVVKDDQDFSVGTLEAISKAIAPLMGKK